MNARSIIAVGEEEGKGGRSCDFGYCGGIPVAAACGAKRQRVARW
jgi:hypothetical protein